MGPLDVRQGDLGLELAGEPKVDLIRSLCAVVKETLVYVTDLLDIESAERESPRFSPNPRLRERAQHLEAGAVISGQGPGWGLWPRGARGPPSQKRLAGRIQNPTAVGRN